MYGGLPKKSLKPRPESSLDSRMYAEFARLRMIDNDRLRVGKVPQGDKMLCSGIDLESYITDTL